MTNEKIDYIIECLPAIDIQKHLNQWAHTYLEIEIIETKIHDNGKITIILKRIKL